MHAGGDLAGAREAQHADEGQLLVFVRAGKLGPDGAVYDLEETGIGGDGRG